MALSMYLPREMVNHILSNVSQYVVLTQATSNRVPCEAHGTNPLNPMSYNVINGKFVCPMIEGNHHGTNQSEMY